jgi:hypothetical protein
MVTENEIKLIAEKIILQRQRLKEIDIEKKQLESERKKIEGQMGWNQTKLIEYLEENDLKKILFDKYSFLVQRLPAKVTKIVKDINEFPDKYKTPQKINKRAILIDYHRKEDLKDLVEITNSTKIIITELKDATVHYTKPKKRIKRLSKDSDS